MVFDTDMAFVVDRVLLSRQQTGMTGGLCSDQLLVHPALSSKNLNVDFFYGRVSVRSHSHFKSSLKSLLFKLSYWFSLSLCPSVSRSLCLWVCVHVYVCWSLFYCVLCFALYWGYVLHSGEIAHKRLCYYYLSSFAWWPVHTFLSLVPQSGTVSPCNVLSSRLALSLSYS